LRLVNLSTDRIDLLLDCVLGMLIFRVQLPTLFSHFCLPRGLKVLLQLDLVAHLVYDLVNSLRLRFTILTSLDFHNAFYLLAAGLAGHDLNLFLDILQLLRLLVVATNNLMRLHRCLHLLFLL